MPWVLSLVLGMKKRTTPGPATCRVSCAGRMSSGEDRWTLSSMEMVHQGLETHNSQERCVRCFQEHRGGSCLQGR